MKGDTDQRRLTALIDRHWQTAYQAAYRVLADRDEALDAAQETVLALSERLGEIVDERAGAWLSRVATNKALDRYRRRRVRSATGEYGDVADREPQPPDLAGRAEMRVRLLDALEGLSGRQREVVVRRTYEDETFVAIAADLGISEGATKVHYRRGMAALRHALDGAAHSREMTDDR